MGNVNQNGQIKVTEPLRVSTDNSVYSVQSVAKGEKPRYMVEKIEILDSKKQTNVRKGARYFGDNLFLEKGARMLLGELRTSLVVSIEYVEPHH